MKYLPLIFAVLLTGCSVTPDLSTLSVPINTNVDFVEDSSVALVLNPDIKIIKNKSTYSSCNSSGCRERHDMIGLPTINPGEHIYGALEMAFRSIYKNVVIFDTSGNVVDFDKVFLVDVEKTAFHCFSFDEDNSGYISHDGANYKIDLKIDEYHGELQNEVRSENFKIEKSVTVKRDAAFSADAIRSSGKSSVEGALLKLRDSIISFLEADLRKKEIQKEFLVASAIGSIPSYWEFIDKYKKYEESEVALKPLAKLINTNPDRIKLFESFASLHPKAASYIPSQYFVYYIGPIGMKIYEILDLKEQGFSDELIASKILSSNSAYKDFSFAEMKQLRQIGLSDELISAMVQSTANVARILAENRQREAMAKFQAQQVEIKRKQAEEQRQQQLSAQQNDAGNNFLKAMTIGLAVTGVAMSDIPLDAAIEPLTALTADVMMDTGGTNLLALSQGYGGINPSALAMAQSGMGANNDPVRDAMESITESNRVIAQMNSNNPPSSNSTYKPTPSSGNSYPSSTYQSQNNSYQSTYGTSSTSSPPKNDYVESQKRFCAGNGGRWDASSNDCDYDWNKGENGVRRLYANNVSRGSGSQSVGYASDMANAQEEACSDGINTNKCLCKLECGSVSLSELDHSKDLAVKACQWGCTVTHASLLVGYMGTSGDPVDCTLSERVIDKKCDERVKDNLYSAYCVDGYEQYKQLAGCSYRDAL